MARNNPDIDLSTREFAELVGRAPSTVSWWMRRGLVAGAYRDGCEWRVPRRHARRPQPKPRRDLYPRPADL